MAKPSALSAFQMFDLSNAAFIGIAFHGNRNGAVDSGMIQKGVIPDGEFIRPLIKPQNFIAGGKFNPGGLILIFFPSYKPAFEFRNVHTGLKMECQNIQKLPILVA